MMPWRTNVTSAGNLFGSVGFVTRALSPQVVVFVVVVAVVVDVVTGVAIVIVVAATVARECVRVVKRGKSDLTAIDEC